MKISKLALVVSILLVAILFSASVFAVTPIPIMSPTPTKTPIPTPTQEITYRMNVNETNWTGKAANDLEIFIKGNVQVLDWWHDSIACPFESMIFWYDPVTDTTIVRFYNGIVNNGQNINNCIFLNQNIKEYQLRRWSWDGVPGDAVGATLSVNFQQTAPGLADITIGNLPIDGGAATITILQIGAAKREYSFAELTWDNPILDQEIVWSVTLTNLHLNKGGSITIPAIPMPAPATGLVYRLKTYLDADPTNIVNYVAQFTSLAVAPHQ